MPGPFDTYGSPWAPVRPFSEVDPLDVEVPAFDPSAFPTEESLIAEMEAEDAAKERAIAKAQNENSAVDARAPLDFSRVEDAKRDFEAKAAEMGLAAKPTLQPDDENIVMHTSTLQPDDENIVFHDEAAQSELLAPVWARGDYDPALEAELEGKALEQNGQPSTAEFAEGPDAVSGADLSTDGILEGAPLSNLTDEELLIQAFEKKQAQEAERTRLEREAAEESAARKIRNAEIYEAEIAKAQARTEDILRRSEELGRRELDSDRWKNSQSTGSKIANAFAIIAGGQLGLASGKGNDAIGFYQGLIDQDIEEQKFNIEKGMQDLNRDRGIVADLYAQTGDLYQATETARLASYEAAIGKIDGQLAKLDPEGTQAMQMEMYKRQLQAAKQARMAKVQEQQRKSALEAAKFQLEVEDKASQIRKREMEMQKLQAETRKLNRRGTGRGGPKITALPYKDQLEYSKNGFMPYLKDGLLVPAPGEDARRAREAYLNGSGSQDPLAQAQQTKAEADARKAVAEADQAERRDTIYSPDKRQALTQKDGSTFKPPTTEEAQELRRVLKSVEDLRHAADLIKIMRRKYGGASEARGSAEYQELKSIVTDIDLEAGVRYNLGALSKDDLENIKNLRGGKDIASFVYDPTFGIEAMAKRATDKANSHLGTMGYNGKRWTPGRVREQVNYERPMRDLEDEILRPKLPHQSERDFIRDRAKDLHVYAKRKPSVSQMRGMAEKIYEGYLDGEYDKETAKLLIGTMREQYEKATGKKTGEGETDWVQDEQGRLRPGDTQPGDITATQDEFFVTILGDSGLEVSPHGGPRTERGASFQNSAYEAPIQPDLGGE